MDLCIVKTLPPTRMMKLIPALASGGLTDDTAFTDDIILRRVKNLEVESVKEITLDLDGMSLTDKHFTIRLIPDAVRLIVPSQG
jgi:diacylglycerol kinase family enzyme